ncbi:MAG: hypothetical protein QXG12_07955 [Thermoproteota archaeon]
MVEFKIKVHPTQRQAYIPKEIVETLGYKLKAKPDRFVVILYPENADMHMVLKSLRVLLADLELSVKPNAWKERKSVRSVFSK